MKIKVPKTINIGAESYRVVLTKNLKIEQGFQGSVNQITTLIEIDPVMPSRRRFVNLLHEIVHIVDIVFGCGMNEENTSRLANGLAQTLINDMGIEFDWSDVPDNKSIDWD